MGFRLLPNGLRHFVARLIKTIYYEFFFLSRRFSRLLISSRGQLNSCSEGGPLSSRCDQVTDTEANLLANTRLIAPIRVGWGPNVEAMMRVEGRPRHMLVSTARLRSSEMTDQARTIGPPTITAWGAKP